MDIILLILNYVLGNWIAILALAFSWLTFKRNSTNIEVDFDDQPSWILAILLESGGSIVNDEYGLFHTNIHILNSSNSNIGFFDLFVIDKKTGEQVTYYNQLQFTTFNGLQSDKAISFLTLNRKQSVVNLPLDNNGVLPAKSFTSLDIIISPKNHDQEILVTFKTVTKSFNLLNLLKRNWRYRYAEHRQSVLVKTLSKPDYEKLLNDQQTV